MRYSKIYLASPLGFSPETRSYLDRIKARLMALGWEIFDPWSQENFVADIRQAGKLNDYGERITSFSRIASGIGHMNEAGIRSADVVLGILDGAEVDSGTASEIGFAAGLGKRCYGLRTDFRDSGDFAGIPVNLQICHFITMSGGKIFRSIDEMDILL